MAIKFHRYRTGRGSLRRPARAECIPQELDIKVQRKLIRMRSQLHLVQLLFALILNPSVNQVLGEYATLQQKIMVMFPKL